jgi:hypothetical protein
MLCDRHSTERLEPRASSSLLGGASTRESCLPLIDFTGFTVMVMLWLVSPPKDRAQFPRYQPARAPEMRKSRTRVLLLAAFDFPALFQLNLLVFDCCSADCYERSLVSESPLTTEVATFVPHRSVGNGRSRASQSKRISTHPIVESR